MTIVVLTDGSDHSTRARGPANRLGRLAGATVVELATDASIPALGNRPQSDSTVCMATRRFGRSGALRSAADLGAPMLCIGPRVVEPPWHPRRGVLVALDGTVESERALGPALRWATMLGAPITLVTVTAETPPCRAGTEDRFRFGPPDPSRYLAGRADDLRSGGATVSTLVLTDRLSAASALRQHLRDDRSSLVVTCTSSRTNLRAGLLRSVAALIIDNSRVPVLLIPPPRIDEGN